MARFKPVYDDREVAILKALYEDPDFHFNSYSLAKVLYPDAPVSTPEAGEAFTTTRDATAKLIERGLVRSKERHKGADGVYFEGLKLTAKGQTEAIRILSEPSQTGLTAQDILDANEVVDEIRKAQK